MRQGWPKDSSAWRRDDGRRAMKRPRAGLWLLLALLLAGCGFSASQEAAAEVMTRYFAAIETRDYEAALTVYAASFFRDTSRDAWAAHLEGYTRQLGDLESYEAVNWNVKKNVGANAGTFVQVTYKIRYSRQPAVEQFILMKADAGFRVIAHRIKARNRPPGETLVI